MIIEQIHELQPDIIIMVGQAGGRKEISLERIAINLDDSKIPDNHGVTPLNDPISIFGPVAYFSTLPLQEISYELQKANIPVALSNTAGTYVCNHVFYSVMHELEQLNNNQIKAGFIHVPYETNQVINKENTFSMDLDIITHALEIIIETTCHRFK